MKKHLKCLYFAFIDIRMRQHHPLYLTETFQSKLKSMDFWMAEKVSGGITLYDPPLPTNFAENKGVIGKGGIQRDTPWY